MTNEALSSDPIADLWREARAWLAAALRDFRGAAEIARTLAHEARAAIRRRLLLIEALLMKLLLIEAARLSPIPPASSRQARAKPAAVASIQTEAAGWKPALHTEDPASPGTWRVRFHLRIPPEPKSARAHNQTSLERLARLRTRPDAEVAQAKARKLARRFESLRRVLTDPRRAIKRLALLLHALGRSARAVARRIALAHPPRAQRLGAALASAIVHGYDASFSFPGDTS